MVTKQFAVADAVLVGCLFRSVTTTNSEWGGYIIHFQGCGCDGPLPLRLPNGTRVSAPAKTLVREMRMVRLSLQ